VTEKAEVRHVKSTSLAEYFIVPTGKDGKSMVTVRQSNRFGTITCLTCRANQCEHIAAAVPEIERVMMEQAAATARETDTQHGAHSAEDAA